MNYKYHREADSCLQSDVRNELQSIPERVTFLSFDQWRAFYNADPENWINADGIVNGNERHKYKIPVYNTTPGDKSHYKNGYIYIKFLTPYDYTQYLDFIEEQEQAGEDYQNEQEILALSKIIQERSEKRLKKIQKELAAAAERNRQLYEKAKEAQFIISGTSYER